jgi:hypothetical protein
MERWEQERVNEGPWNYIGSFESLSGSNKKRKRYVERVTSTPELVPGRLSVAGGGPKWSGDI